MCRALKRFVIAKTHSLTRNVRIIIHIRIIIDMEPVVKRKKQQSVATDVGKTRFCSRANNNTKRAPVSNKNRLVPISRTADSI